jgi:hypothetical protein
MPIVESKQFAAKADGKHLNPHAAPARDQKMTELVEEHDDGQDEQERNRIADEPMAQRIETMKKKLGHPIPLDVGAARPVVTL